MKKKILKKDLRIDMRYEINLEYSGYNGLSKETRLLCAKYNREHKKLIKLMDEVFYSMQHDYNTQNKIVANH